MSNPRVMYAMAEDGSLPKIFTRQNEKTNVLTYSLTIFAAACIIILFFAQEFDKILGFTIFLDCFGMVLSSATIFWFRKKTKHLDDTGIYKMKFYPVMPIIFIAAYLFVVISIFADDPNTGLLGLGILGVFMGIYFVFKRTATKV